MSDATDERIVDNREADSNCPNCGAPMRDDLQQHIHESDGTCDYAAGLLAKVKQAQYERNNAIESEAKWRVRAERAEAALRRIAEAGRTTADAARIAREALEARDE